MTRAELRDHLDKLYSKKQEYIIKYGEDTFKIVENSIIETYNLNIDNILEYRLFKEVEKEIEKQVKIIINKKLSYDKNDKEYLTYSLHQEINKLLIDMEIIKEEIINEVL